MMGSTLSIAGTACIALCTVSIGAQTAPSRFAEVTVMVRRPDGTGLAKLPIGARPPVYPDDKAAFWSAVTNDQGNAVGSAELVDGAAALDVGLTTDVSTADQHLLAKAAPLIFTDTLRTWACRNFTAVSVPAGATAATATINLVLSRKVLFDVSRSGQPAITPGVRADLHGWNSLTEKVGTTNRWQIVGVPQGEACLVVIWSGADGVVREIPAGTADVDLGTVDVGARLNGRARIDITRHQKTAYTNTVMTELAATLVKSDGTAVYGFARKRPFKDAADGDMFLREERAGDAGDELQVPAGTYYVVPGYFLGTPRQTRFLRLLRANALPANHGVPSITVQEGTVLRYTVQPDPINVSMKALLNTPVPPPPPPPNP